MDDLYALVVSDATYNEKCEIEIPLHLRNDGW